MIEAKRGKRLNVLAAMMSNGDLLSAKYWQTTTADLFAGFLGLLHEYIERCAGKPITIIVDNASIHKAKSIQPVIELLKSKGMNLYFLPPYSPELNRIERLWHKMKYTWLTPKCRDPKMLEADVGEILTNFGDGYKFAF